MNINTKDHTYIYNSYTTIFHFKPSKNDTRTYISEIEKVFHMHFYMNCVFSVFSNKEECQAIDPCTDVKKEIQ